MSDLVRGGRYDAYVKQLEVLKKTSSEGTDYWLARDLQMVLGYTDHRNFEDVIDKAMKGSDAAGWDPEHHFVETTALMELGKGARRVVRDWFLSRYACYMIALSGDSQKQEIAFAKTYFAIQARRQEVQDQQTADEKRIMLRNRVKDANKGLASAAKRAGVRRYAIFQDEGYRGLYGGLGREDIKALKQIPPNQELLDCIDRTELAANEFRITQAHDKLVRDGVNDESTAIATHRTVGKEVRGYDQEDRWRNA